MSIALVVKSSNTATEQPTPLHILHRNQGVLFCNVKFLAFYLLGTDYVLPFLPFIHEMYPFRIALQSTILNFFDRLLKTLATALESSLIYGLIDIESSTDVYIVEGKRSVIG